MKTFKEYVEKKGVRLWLDDVRNPRDKLIQQNYGALPGMVWVKTVGDAISVLEQGNVTYLSFDHDLGTVATGYDLACWVERKAFDGEISKFDYRIHSDNPIGKANIIRAMKNAEKFWNRNENDSIS